MPVAKISGLFKPMKKALTSIKAKRDRSAPEKTRATSQLNDTVKDGVTNPRQSVVKKNGSSALERRFTKDTMWESDRQSMMTAISAQIAKHGGKGLLSVPVNGKDAQLSSSMVIDQLQLFVSMPAATDSAPTPLSPMMHASLQLWQDVGADTILQDVGADTTTGGRQHPFVADLNKKVDEALRKAGSYRYLAKVGKTAAQPTNPITPDSEPIPAPTGRPLTRRFVRNPTGAADNSQPVSLISKTEKIAAAPVTVETKAMPFLEPLPYHPMLLDMGPVIDGAKAPTDSELFSLLKAGPDQAIAAVPVEGGRLLLRAVSRQPQFEDGIALGARTINLNPDLAGKCSNECVLVKDLRKLLGERMYTGE